MHPVFFEVVIFALIVVVAVTQVILPTIANAPLFPSFRFKRHHRKILDAQDAIEEARLEAAAVAAQRQADEIVADTPVIDKKSTREFQSGVK